VRLPTEPVAALPSQPEEGNWLIESLWSAEAVGIIGGAPKCCKSWLALDMAVSVASGTACLGRFEAQRPGPVVVFLAEDPLPQLKDRVAQICRHRGLPLEGVPLHAITAPSLRLDVEDDRLALEETLAELRPRLLVLDPLVRLHSRDENASADIAELLGFLRRLNRTYEVAITLVHHMAKRARRDPGQALRGSSDLHAWTDSACYLLRRPDALRLVVEHRAAAAPEPLEVRLVQEPCHLEVCGAEPAPLPLAEAVRAELRRAEAPLSRAALRRTLKVNNARLGETLLALEARGLLERSPVGWMLVVPRQDQIQLAL